MLPMFVVLFLLVDALFAQKNPDPRLAASTHLAALTQSDFSDLLSQAQSGDREASIGSDKFMQRVG